TAIDGGAPRAGRERDHHAALLGNGRKAACRAPRPRREGRIAAGIDDNKIADDLELSSRLLDLLDQLVQIDTLHDELGAAADNGCDGDQVVGPAFLGGGAMARKIEKASALTGDAFEP